MQCWPMSPAYEPNFETPFRLNFSLFPFVKISKYSINAYLIKIYWVHEHTITEEGKIWGLNWTCLSLCLNDRPNLQSLVRPFPKCTQYLIRTIPNINLRWLPNGQWPNLSPVGGVTIVSRQVADCYFLLDVYTCT